MSDESDSLSEQAADHEVESYRKNYAPRGMVTLAVDRIAALRSERDLLSADKERLIAALRGLCREAENAGLPTTEYRRVIQETK